MEREDLRFTLLLVSFPVVILVLLLTFAAPVLQDKQTVCDGRVCHNERVWQLP